MNKSSLGLFSSFAQALISFFLAFIKFMTVVEKTVAMTDAAVTSAQEDQAIDLELKRIDYQASKVAEATLRHAKREEDLKTYASGNDERKELVERTQKMLNDRVSKRLAELRGHAA